MSDCIRIGSRGSELALRQSEWVRDRLRELYPAMQVEVEVISTVGDRMLDVPLAKIGSKGLFTKELEVALLENRIDLAVHSAKDMPTTLPEGLRIVAFTKREDAHDVFVARRPRAGELPPRSIRDLPFGARVGSSSLRRRSQLLALRPDLELVDIRGNVQTRLRKMEEQGMAGTVLAAAGLARLGLSELVTFTFTLDEMLPAAGQGSLAVEIRSGDARIIRLLTPLNYEPSALAVRTERALMRDLDGGCQVPIGAHAELLGDQLHFMAYVGSLDGSQSVRSVMEAPGSMPEQLGGAVAQSLLARGAGDLLLDARLDFSE